MSHARTNPYVLAAATLLATSASANTEIPTHFDSRHAAMGSTGAAFADNPSAAYYNPAAIDGMRRLSATAAFAPFGPALQAPFLGSQRTSERQLSPLFFVGAAYRLPVLSDRVVVGFAFYPTAGMGGTYKNIEVLGGEEVRASILSLEAAVPISVRLMEGLAVAVAPRFTYASQTSRIPQLQGTTPVMTEQDLSGTSLAGVSVGVFYQPTRALRLGLSYRSKVSVDITGSTEAAGASFDTSSTYVMPHSFRAGAAFSLLDDQVLLALDLRYSLYGESNKTSTTTVQMPGAPPATSTMVMNWKNSLTACVGTEYVLRRMFPLRIGYTITNSATPADTATIFTPPPGLIHSIHAGAGLKLARWNVDLAVYHTFGGSSGVSASTDNTGAGTYKINTYLAALSANYHF